MPVAPMPTSTPVPTPEPLPTPVPVPTPTPEPAPSPMPMPSPVPTPTTPGPMDPAASAAPPSFSAILRCRRVLPLGPRDGCNSTGPDQKGGRLLSQRDSEQHARHGARVAPYRTGRVRTRSGLCANTKVQARVQGFAVARKGLEAKPHRVPTMAKTVRTM